MLRRKRLHSECGDSVSECTTASSGGDLDNVESARQLQLRAAREEHAATRLQLEELRRASREQQGHVVTQLQELEGCTAAEGGDGGQAGGGLCVADLHRQLKVYATQEQDATAALERLEQQHRARLAALLAPPEGPPPSAAAILLGSRCAPAALQGLRPRGALQQREQQRQGGEQAAASAQAPAAADGAQPVGIEEEEGVGAAEGREQHQEQQQEQQQQQQHVQEQQLEPQAGPPDHGPGPGPQPQPGAQQGGLQAMLESEAARVDAEMARVAMQQQLASSRLEQRRSKKARIDSISQVWEWLHGGGTGAGGGGGGSGGGAPGVAELGEAPQHRSRGCNRRRPARAEALHAPAVPTSANIPQPSPFVHGPFV